MATVVSVNERYQGISSTLQDRGYTHTREFIVLLSGAVFNGAELSISATGIPRIGDVYNTGSLTKVSKISAKLLDEKSRLAYLVSVDYAETTINNQSSSNNDDIVFPWQVKAVHSYDFNIITKPIEKDYSSEKKPILNSANYSFENQPNTDSANITINIQRATTNFNPSAALALIGSVNKSVCGCGGVNIAAKHGRLLKWSGTEQVFEWTTKDMNGTETKHEKNYFTESIEVEATSNEKGYLLEILDQGFYSSDKKRIQDENGKDVVQAVLLDGQGNKLENGDPVYLEFEIYPASEWNILNLK